jgi:hypothetical protein
MDQEIHSRCSKQKNNMKSLTHVKLFAIFPEAHNMLVRWGKANLQTLNSETACQCLPEQFRIACQDEFMTFIGLKTLSTATAWRWLRLLGFQYKSRKNVITLMVTRKKKTLGTDSTSSQNTSSSS